MTPDQIEISRQLGAFALVMFVMLVLPIGVGLLLGEWSERRKDRKFAERQLQMFNYEVSEFRQKEDGQ